jgi:colanic acid/amylovoran biosynthesis glycosyltransferase
MRQMHADRGTYSVETEARLSTLDIPAAARAQTWWRPKASNLLNVLYLTLFVGSVSFLRSLHLFVLSVITIVGIGAFGHLINDWFDTDVDERAGKPNRFARFSVWQKRWAIFGALAIGLLPWIMLPRNRVSLGLLGVEMLLLLLYATPPVRLKDRIYLAVISDAAYAYALPAALAAHTVLLAAARSYDTLFVGALFLWQVLLGIRHYLNHLALDRIHDLAARTSTLAIIKGNRYVHTIVRKLILPLEVACFGLVLLRVGHYSVALVAACVASFLVFSTFPLVLAVARAYSLLSYRFSNGSLDVFYQNLLPLVVIVFLMRRDVRFVLLPLLQFLPFLAQPIGRASGRPMRARYCGYWPFRIVLGPAATLSKRIVAAGEDRSVISTNDLNIRDGKATNIVVANINRAKYTETFINEMLPHLKYNVYYLWGGELPVYDNDHRHVLSGEPILHSLALLLESLFRLDQGHCVKNSIANYCQVNKIRTVLAEFGPVGVQLLPITRDLGIPLIVYFHGYDVFHEPTWMAQAMPYKMLFVEADKILVVSRLMGERLTDSGAPPEKIVHLPAFVNLELFPYRDHSRLPPRFITVGRFAETKSPHLTIVAFKKVLEAVPEATLVMIGKGGGGELFEACLILAKALGLEDRIIFKGVLDHNQVALEMAKSRVFVQHSITTPENHDKEGKPVAIMEAMASGLPVVATRHSGITELITNEEDGLLVEEYDLDAMAAAMIRLAADNSLVRSLGENASRRIHNDPLIRDHIRILEGIIDACISG